MRRPISIVFAVIASATVALSGAAAADGFTTRIETRPFYGAVTTIEHGVRVIRPLPPDRYVIINPNRTPLSLSFSESNVYGAAPTAPVDHAGIGRSDLATANPDGPIYSYPAYGSRYWRHSPGHHPGGGIHGHVPGAMPGRGTPGAIGAH